MDGDGHVDLVAARQNGNAVSVSLGDGTGAFAAPAAYPAGGQPADVQAGDLDGDGDLDLVVAAQSADAATVLLGAGDGSFAAPVSYPAGDVPNAVALGDFDADGALDLATANFNDGDVTVRLGNGAGGFGPVASHPALTGARGLVVADVDADAKPDLAVAGSSGSAAVLLGDGDGGFAPAATVAAGTGSFSVAAAQLDGDGAVDLAVGNNGGGDVSILRNVPEPALTLGSAGHGYGVQDVGTTSAGHAFTVTSTGNAPLALGAIEVDGPFLRVGGSCDPATALIPDTSCTVELAFAPGDTGAAAGELRILADALGAPATAGLTGTGRYVAPACAPVAAAVPFGATLTIALSCAGQGSLAYERLDAPAHGLLSGLDAAAGTVTYTPFPGYHGPDAFTYRAANADAGSAPATVEVTVGAPPATGPDVTFTTEPTACADGRDDDGNGYADFPLDAGCRSADDTSERRPCPTARRGTADRALTLAGSKRGDRIRAGGGADCVRAAGGNDRVDGDAGDDQLSGGAGADTLRGGTGADALHGDAGRDRLIGGSGDDRLVSAGDGDVDSTIDCGPGTDVAVTGPGERTRGCEHVIRLAR